MLNFHTLDVFTTTPYAGNPLAVVLNADALTTAQMQTIAREFNLSETLFVQQPDDPAHTAKVRIFFPTAEIPFAGHPTIGCAILLAENQFDGDFETEITLEEVAGLVPVSVSRKGNDIQAEFTAPVIPYALDVKAPDPETLASGLNLPVAGIGFDDHAFGIFEGGPNFAYIPVASIDALSRAKIGSGWEALTKQIGTNSAYVYTRTETGYAARMFSPGDGIPEDPATGSASAIFAAQLLASGDLREGTNNFHLEQGVDMGRPSQIKLSIDLEDSKITAIRIAGTAVRISHGTLETLPSR